jgi:hypothetical protein
MFSLVNCSLLGVPFRSSLPLYAASSISQSFSIKPWFSCVVLENGLTGACGSVIATVVGWYTWMHVVCWHVGI